MLESGEKAARVIQISAGPTGQVACAIDGPGPFTWMPRRERAEAEMGTRYLFTAKNAAHGTGAVTSARSAQSLAERTGESTVIGQEILLVESKEKIVVVSARMAAAIRSYSRDDIDVCGAGPPG